MMLGGSVGVIKMVGVVGKKAGCSWGGVGTRCCRRFPLVIYIQYMIDKIGHLLLKVKVMFCFIFKFHI